MNKAKFFALLNDATRTHHARADEVEVYTHEESAEKQAELLAIAGRREWAFYLVGISIRGCWHINAQDANSADKMRANEVTARRWLAEWLEQNGERLNAEADAHEAAEAKAAAALTAKRVKHFITRAAEEGYNVAEADARRLVPMFEGVNGWSFFHTLRRWEEEQQEAKRCHLLNLIAGNADPELAQAEIARAAKLSGADLDREYAFMLARFTMTADDLIAVVSNADEDEISRQACSNELAHRCGPVTNVAACSL